MNKTFKGTIIGLILGLALVGTSVYAISINMGRDVQWRTNLAPLNTDVDLGSSGIPVQVGYFKQLIVSGTVAPYATSTFAGNVDITGDFYITGTTISGGTVEVESVNTGLFTTDTLLVTGLATTTGQHVFSDTIVVRSLDSDYEVNVNAVGAEASSTIAFTNGDTGTTLSDGFLVGIDESENAYLKHKENKDINFFTNDTQVMTIQESGYVGIGTASPTNELQIGTGVMSTIGFGSRAYIFGGLQSSNLIAGIGSNFNNSGSGAVATDATKGAAGIMTSTLLATDADIIFYADNTANTITERMRVVGSSGNVGIGIAAPSSDLHVYDAGSDSIITIESTGNGSSSGLAYRKERDTGTGYIGACTYVDSDTSTSDSEWILDVDTSVGCGAAYGAQQRFAVDSDGDAFFGNLDVGIEVANPVAKLDVYTATTAKPAARFQANPGTGYGVEEIYFSNSSKPAGVGFFTFGLFSNNSAGAYNTLYLNSGTAGRNRFMFGDTGDPDIGRFEYDNVQNDFSFWTSNTERVVINASGYLGVNTTTPSYFLSLAGEINMEDTYGTEGLVTSGSGLFGRTASTTSLGNCTADDGATTYCASFPFVASESNNSFVVYINVTEQNGSSNTIGSHISSSAGTNVATAGTKSMFYSPTVTDGYSYIVTALGGYYLEVECKFGCTKGTTYYINTWVKGGSGSGAETTVDTITIKRN